MLFFLDIDGVMIPAKSWESPAFLDDGFPAFSSKATNVLRQFISKEVTVMLTTSHRARFNIEEWKAIFRNRGINVEKMKMLPENVHNLNRKDELIHWFTANTIDEHFVIIDDDKSLNELPDLLKGNWVKTEPYTGLTGEHAAAIKSIVHKATTLPANFLK